MFLTAALLVCKPRGKSAGAAQHALLHKRVQLNIEHVPTCFMPHVTGVLHLPGHIGQTLQAISELLLLLAAEQLSAGFGHRAQASIRD